MGAGSMQIIVIEDPIHWRNSIIEQKFGRIKFYYFPGFPIPRPAFAPPKDT